MPGFMPRRYARRLNRWPPAQAAPVVSGMPSASAWPIARISVCTVAVKKISHVQAGHYNNRNSGELLRRMHARIAQCARYWWPVHLHQFGREEP
jgi:hypothetical protein